MNATFTVFQSADVSKVQRLFNLLNTLGYWLPFILVAMAALGIYLAPNHRLAFIWTGIGVTLAALVTAIALQVVRSRYLDGVPSNILPPDAAATPLRHRRTLPAGGDPGPGAPGSDRRPGGVPHRPVHHRRHPSAVVQHGVGRRQGRHRVPGPGHEPGDAVGGAEGAAAAGDHGHRRLRDPAPRALPDAESRARGSPWECSPSSPSSNSWRSSRGGAARRRLP